MTPKKLIVSLVFVFSTTSPAAVFNIVNRTSDLNPLNLAENALLSAFNSAADDIEAQINNGILSETSRQTVCNAMSSANRSAGAALWMDRASNATRFSVSAGLQANLHSESTSFNWTSLNFSADNELPSLGLGPQAAVSIGIPGSAFGFKKKGPFAGDRIMFFLNGMYFKGSYREVSGQLYNFGGNLIYKIIPPVGATLAARWGGLQFGTGLNYSASDVNYTATMTTTSTQTVSGETADITMDLDYTVGVRNTTFTIPFEASTNVQFLYIFTIYAGASMDFNVGSSRLTGVATGPVNATSDSPTASGIPNLFSGDAVVDLDDGTKGEHQSTSLRAFAGLQLNFSAFKIALDYSYMPNKTFGLSGIIRAAL